MILKMMIDQPTDEYINLEKENSYKSKETITYYYNI